MGSIIQPEFELIKTIDFSPEILKGFGKDPLWKVDETTHSVYGLSTAEVPDADREIACYADSKQNYESWGQATAAITSAAGQKVSYGNIRYQHTTRIAGKANRIDYFDDKRQIWLLTQPVDDQIWQQLADGFLTGYSHAGKYEYRRCSVCAYDLPAGNYCPQCHKDVATLYAPILSEVSYVDRPCLGIATYAYVKANGQVEMRKFVAPEAKTYITELRGLAARFTSDFMRGVDDLEKRARNPVGQFATNASGPLHEAAAASGYEHKRTGDTSGGSPESVVSRDYERPGGARLTLCDDGRWTHSDGKGRTTTGTGADALASHLAACHAKKSAPGAVEDVIDMDQAEFQKQLREGIAAGVKDALKAARKDDADDDEIECPYCGAEIEIPPGYDDDEIDCPQCGEEVDLGADKALKAAVVARALRIVKAVKYLVTEKDGTQHLPYTDEDGNPDHRLMGAAWAALHGGYRGKKYEGPDKQKAIDKLTAIYKKEGMDTPSESDKAAAIKAFGDFIERRFQKDMGSIGRLADILQSIRWLQQGAFFEGQWEQDDRDFVIADRLGYWLSTGVDILGSIFEEETSELLAEFPQPGNAVDAATPKMAKFAVPALLAAIEQKGEIDMKVDELLNKAAKGLKAHFGKAAAFHEMKADAHKDMADAHKAAHDHFGKAEGEDAKVHKAFHKTASAHHEKLHKAHKGMCESCKSAAESMGSEEAKADDASELTKTIADLRKALAENKATLSPETEANLKKVADAIGSLEKIETISSAVEQLKADVEKIGKTPAADGTNVAKGAAATAPAGQAVPRGGEQTSISTADNIFA